MAEKKFNKCNNQNGSLQHKKDPSLVSARMSLFSRLTTPRDNDIISPGNAQQDIDSGSLESRRLEETQVMIGPELPDQLIINAVSPAGNYS